MRMNITLGMDWFRSATLVGLLLSTAGCGDGCGGRQQDDDEPGEADGCGLCPRVSAGQSGATGVKSIDALFEVAASLQQTTRDAHWGFDRDLRALADAWGAPIDSEAELDVAAVDALFDTIEAQLQSAEFSVSLQPARCSANLAVGALALAHCEAQANCDVSDDAGFTCEGTCNGACEGTCQGDVACSTDGGMACEGSCEGACALPEPDLCEGTCSGTCTLDGQAQQGFEGTCDGVCEGTCTLPSGGRCAGTCHGTCVVPSEAADACPGQRSCRGSCDATCEGACEGHATPASTTSACEATTECQSAASLQASAHVQCRPPRVHFDLSQADDHAALQNRLRALEHAAGSIGMRHATLAALLIGDYDADGTADATSLTERLHAPLSSILDPDAEFLDDIPSGRLICLIPTITEAGEVVGDASRQGAASLELHAAFFSRVAAL